MKKNRCTLFAICVLVLFFGINLSADAAYCNSPCPNPCAQSRTICEGVNCTTYCGTSNYNTVYYSTPGVSFSYSTPNVSFSVSNEYIGLDILKINGRPVYRYHPAVHHAGRPAIGHPPVKHPVAQRPPQKPIYDKPVIKPKTTVKSVSKPAKRV